MKKIILATMILAPTISLAAAETDFNNMNCTQAVVWVAKKITSPSPPHFTIKEWNKFTTRGRAETAAISILSLLPGSPCFKSSPEINMGLSLRLKPKNGDAFMRHRPASFFGDERSEWGKNSSAR